MGEGRSAPMSAPERAVLRNITRDTVLATDVRFALKRRERTRGLLGRDSMEPGEALAFPRCRQVHMFGMKFAIDVLFLDKANRVVHLEPDLAGRQAVSVGPARADCLRASRRHPRAVAHRPGRLDRHRLTGQP